MGLITELIRERHDTNRQKDQIQADAARTILEQYKTNPGAFKDDKLRDWATGIVSDLAEGKKPGGKGGGGGGDQPQSPIRKIISVLVGGGGQTLKPGGQQGQGQGLPSQLAGQQQPQQQPQNSTPTDRTPVPQQMRQPQPQAPPQPTPYQSRYYNSPQEQETQALGNQQREFDQTAKQAEIMAVNKRKQKLLDDQAAWEERADEADRINLTGDSKKAYTATGKLPGRYGEPLPTAAQNLQDALQAKADELGVPVDQLKAQDKIDAVNKVAASRTTAVQTAAAAAKPKPATDLDKVASYFAATGVPEDEAKKKAGELLVRNQEAKAKLAQTKAAGGAGGGGAVLNREQLTALAQGEIAGLGTPSFGLSANNPNRLEYQKAKADILLGRGVGEAAGERADIKAQSRSVSDLVQTRGRLSAFERTAKANLDNFITQAKQVVDSGSPWVNKPLREALTGAAGSAEISAFRAARQVALNEIARIVSNPNLSGALSDSARHEIELISPESSTLHQILAVSEVLKSDMANRIEGMDKEIEEKRGAVRGAAGGSKTPLPGDGKTPEIAPTDRAAYDALPSGAKYTQNGKTFTKK